MRNLNYIPLSALRAIEAIARTGTLTQAAEELGVSPGALSQRLTKAEAALQQTLFLRTSIGLVPTPLCADIAPRLSRAMDDLSRVVEEIRNPAHNTLTVSAAPLFASRWLIWRIQRFQKANPDISLRILPQADILDLDRSDVDVGIRICPEPAAGPRAIKLLEQRVFPICAPHIAHQIHTPADVLLHPVIRENEALYGWHEWLNQESINAPQFKHRLPHGPTYADAAMCLDAAMTGQGVFMAWETLACDALGRGQIAAPFAQRCKTLSSYWFVPSRYAARKPSVQKFHTWLSTELANSVADWRDGTP